MYRITIQTFPRWQRRHEDDDEEVFSWEFFEMIIKNLIKETNLPETSRAANEAPKKPAFSFNKSKQNGAGSFRSVVKHFHRIC